MRRQRVQMDGQILLGVLDLTRAAAGFGGGFNPPAVALLFDQIAGTVQHAAHGQAVLVSYDNVCHMGNFPPPGAQSSKFAAAEEAGGDAPLKPANASVVGSRTKACGGAKSASCPNSQHVRTIQPLRIGTIRGSSQTKHSVFVSKPRAAPRPFF